MDITYQSKPGAGAVVAVFVAQDKKLGAQGKALDARLGGAVSRALSAPAFAAKREQLIDIVALAGDGPKRVVIVGVGNPRELTAYRARSVGGALTAHLMAAHEAGAALLVDPPKGAPLSEGEFAANLALGARLRSYHFGKYQTKPRADKPKPIDALTVVTARVAEAKRLDERLGAVAEGVRLARDLVNEPPNTLYPEAFADRAKTLTKLGVKVEVLDVAAMKKLGMGAILAVGGGSARPPRLLVLQYNGARKGDPIALVGKGVCFDAGGLCLKKPSGMITMKGDMAGGAAVVGAVHALARRRAKVNVVGVVGLVENLPSGSAYKPGDIVTTMSGQTIEVIDTDAEGRMVLVDALHYTATRFKPACIIDLATLTYAVMAAVGGAYSGIFCNQERLYKDLTGAGETTGERLWRLPLDGYYDENLESPIADFRHHGTDSESADAAHAAALLKNFIDGRPWAHLDIANKEFAEKDRPLMPVGASGYGVALLEEFATGHESGR
ncbi:MAG TPA: leucyl aminopeptidase [Dongiaceae bacterium]|jgi:leucyl aminopeptidase|nr:leucyl aminopeptidase [Dongiaceae bacterium]